MIITQIIIFLICTLWIIKEIITFIIHIIILRKLKNIYNTNYLGPVRTQANWILKQHPLDLGPAQDPLPFGPALDHLHCVQLRTQANWVITMAHYHWVLMQVQRQASPSARSRHMARGSGCAPLASQPLHYVALESSQRKVSPREGAGWLPPRASQP